MKSYTCPSCGASLQFVSVASVFMVCRYCHSTLIRHDIDLEALGKMATLKDDFSPLQVGSSGVYQDHFTIVGRVHLDWTDGFWNEWYLRFNDGTDGWLAEAQGSYLISRPAPAPSSVSDAKSLRIGEVIEISGVKYSVSDIKQVKISFAEGELPFSANQGDQTLSIDLARGGSEFASLSFDDDGKIDAFVGHYLEFEQFSFQNLRQIDGW